MSGDKTKARLIFLAVGYSAIILFLLYWGGIMSNNLVATYMGEKIANALVYTVSLLFAFGFVFLASGIYKINLIKFDKSKIIKACLAIAFVAPIIHILLSYGIQVFLNYYQNAAFFDYSSEKALQSSTFIYSSILNIISVVKYTVVICAAVYIYKNALKAIGIYANSTAKPNKIWVIVFVVIGWVLHGLQLVTLSGFMHENTWLIGYQYIMQFVCLVYPFAVVMLANSRILLNADIQAEN